MTGGGSTMKVYSDAEVVKNLPILLKQAQEEGAVAIRRDDGRTFVISPESRAGSPLDVAGVALALTAAEIVSFVHESRREAP
jgi:hypothetical protein